MTTISSPYDASLVNTEIFLKQINDFSCIIVEDEPNLNDMCMLFNGNEKEVNWAKVSVNVGENISFSKTFQSDPLIGNIASKHILNLKKILKFSNEQLFPNYLITNLLFGGLTPLTLYKGFVFSKCFNDLSIISQNLLLSTVTIVAIPIISTYLAYILSTKQEDTLDGSLKPNRIITLEHKKSAQNSRNISSSVSFYEMSHSILSDIQKVSEEHDFPDLLIRKVSDQKIIFDALSLEQKERINKESKFIKSGADGFLRDRSSLYLATLATGCAALTYFSSLALYNYDYYLPPRSFTVGYGAESYPFGLSSMYTHRVDLEYELVTSALALVSAAVGGAFVACASIHSLWKNIYGNEDELTSESPPKSIVMTAS